MSRKIKALTPVSAQAIGVECPNCGFFDSTGKAVKCPTCGGKLSVVHSGS